MPGQDLIRRVTQIARMPEFEGRILLVEDYDLRLARRLVSGVDVWLNNPVYPLEASGTSGMKAGINGVLNLSVLDGWWDEGYDGKNGWAIKPVAESLDDARRNREEAKTLYELLQDHVIPTYYRRGDMGYSPEWIRHGQAFHRHAAAALQLHAHGERVPGQVLPAGHAPGPALHGERLRGRPGSLAVWKAHVRASWDNVRLRRLDTHAATSPTARACASRSPST